MLITPGKFQLGQVFATRAVVETIPHGEIQFALVRHVTGDWGEVCDEDKAANDRALIEGSRLLSVYRTDGGQTFWIITEWDRSATTVLFPSEY